VQGRFDTPLAVASTAPPDHQVLGGLLHCHRWAAGLDAAPPLPASAWLDAPRGCELLMLHIERAALSLDPAAITSLQALAQTTTAAQASDDTWLQLARCFLALASGQPVQPATLTDLERAGREHRDAGLVLRAATLRALASEAVGGSDDAVEHARRAFRMARTEHRPQAEYWAGWTLARQRRLTGRPYLASRILGAQRRYAPPPWHRWIDLQRTLAEGTLAPETRGDLRDALACAQAGDRAGFDQRLRALMPVLDGFAPLRSDVHDLLASLGEETQPPRPVVHDWRGAASPFAPPPCGLAAVAHTPLAVVLAQPGAPGVRMLGLANTLLPKDISRAHMVDKPGRTESLLAALALVGPDGLTEDALFAAVYGFTYNATLHRGAWDVALHRARSACAELAILHRNEGRVWLEVAHRFVVPDPRCQRAHEDRVLQRLASAEGTSARELASGLGLSLRTVQDVLRDLVETGACQQHRDGRRRTYSVEDTTFQEPTRSGSKP
jgi:hypothetical protein